MSVMWMPAILCEKQVGDHSAFKRDTSAATETVKIHGVCKAYQYQGLIRK